MDSDFRVFLPLFLSVLALADDTWTASFEVTEKQPVGTTFGNLTSIYQLQSKYSDVELSKLRFSQLQGPVYNPALDYIVVQETTGLLQIKKLVDRDVLCPTMVSCPMSFDVGVSPAQYFQIISVRIEILDLNDHAPTFPLNTSNINIMESVLPGSSFQLHPSAIDPDSPANSVQRYELTPANLIANRFEVRWKLPENTVQLIVTGSVDRPPVDFYLLTLTAVDGGSPPLNGSMLLNITIEDVNDNSPVFSQASYQGYVYENATAGTRILAVKATDADRGLNAQVFYGFSVDTNSQPWSSLFQIDAQGNITLSRAGLDREKVSKYSLVVLAYDGGSPSRTSSVSVTITVTDVNDNAPHMTVNTLTSDGVAQITENMDVGTFVALLSVTDSDQGSNGNTACFLTSWNTAFELVDLQTSGMYKIVTKDQLDADTRDQYNLTVECDDMGVPRLTSSCFVPVKVIDLNDNAPQFTQTLYNASVLENSSPGTSLIQVTATDRDSGDNGLVSYSILGDSIKYFTIDNQTGLIQAAVAFDYETQRFFQIQVKVEDHGVPAKYNTTLVNVFVIDVNDIAPRFLQSQYEFLTQETPYVNVTVGYVTAFDPEPASYGLVVYSMPNKSSSASGVFRVDPNSGRIFTAKSLKSQEQQIYQFVVGAGNAGYPQLTGTANVTVYVKGAKDDFPAIDFPNSDNNTVQISNTVPKGQQITRVMVRDTSVDLWFTINGNETNFSIDHRTGSVFVNTDLSGLAESVFQLNVSVADQTIPLLSTDAILFIVVKEVVQAPAISSNNPLVSNPNLVIIVCIVATTMVLVLLLVVAIVCVLLRAKGKKKALGSPDRSTFTSVSTAISDPKIIPPPHGVGFEDGDISSKPSSRSSSNGSACSELTKNAPTVPGNGSFERDSTSSDSGRGPSEQDFHSPADLEYFEKGKTSGVHPVPLNFRSITSSTPTLAASVPRLTVLETPPRRGNSSLNLASLPVKPHQPPRLHHVPRDETGYTRYSDRSIGRSPLDRTAHARNSHPVDVSKMAAGTMPLRKSASQTPQRHVRFDHPYRENVPERETTGNTRYSQYGSSEISDDVTSITSGSYYMNPELMCRSNETVSDYVIV